MSPQRLDRLWGPPNLLFNGRRELFLRGLTRPERETNRLPPTGSEVKKTWIYTSTPHTSYLTRTFNKCIEYLLDRLCGLVVRVLGYRSGGPGSIPGTTKKK
jgi:hypothetical protein